MKKAQISEFIGILILVLVLISFIIFNRISSAGFALAEGNQFIAQYEKEQIWTGANILMLVTIDGTMLIELLGYYECYGNPVVSFDQKRNINIGDLLIPTLDHYYGPDNWNMQLNYETTYKCITSNGFFDGECGRRRGNVQTYDFFYPRACEINMGRGKLFITP